KLAIENLKDEPEKIKLIEKKLNEGIKTDELKIFDNILFQKYLILSPWFAQNNYMIGTALTKLGRHREAAPYYHRASTFFPMQQPGAMQR
ncbi:MAG: hypothetical protein QG635_797, partial [Bacteroidota bacterium]|nr:hypothetical protein [Bacteroidota bacterium]